MPKDNKDGKMTYEQVETMLKLLLLQRSTLGQKLKAIQDSELSNEEKFQRLAELINPIGGDGV